METDIRGNLYLVEYYKLLCKASLSDGLLFCLAWHLIVECCRAHVVTGANGFWLALPNAL